MAREPVSPKRWEQIFEEMSPLFDWLPVAEGANESADKPAWLQRLESKLRAK